MPDGVPSTDVQVERTVIERVTFRMARFGSGGGSCGPGPGNNTPPMIIARAEGYGRECGLAATQPVARQRRCRKGDAATLTRATVPAPHQRSHNRNWAR